ncbi:nucleotide-binding alpha-beta plait domain-containing protein [Tanacetum coccineum]
MGDCDWTEVSRKKKRFIIGSQRSKEDEVQKLSTCVFVTNFPDLFNAKDLWNTCKQYGNVVDDPKQSSHTKMENKPALVLDNSCLNQHDYSNYHVVTVKDLLRFTLEGVLGSQSASKYLSLMGRGQLGRDCGIPLKMWPENTFNRIASIWDTLLHVENQEDECYHRKRICINTNVKSNIFESFKAIYQGKVFWVRAKEIPKWVPDIMEDDNEESDMDDAINEEESNGEDVDFKKFSASEGDK